jgi:hypothetical protein
MIIIINIKSHTSYHMFILMNDKQRKVLYCHRKKGGMEGGKQRLLELIFVGI